MKPALYLKCLQKMEENDGLSESKLRPVLASDITTIERELNTLLPSSYEEFLREVGVGEEYGGLARWPHFDITHANNIMQVSQKLKNEELEKLKELKINASRFPKDFLVIYDACDGQYFGFSKTSNYYNDKVIMWDSEENRAYPVADDFRSFLDYLCTLSEEEIDELQSSPSKQHKQKQKSSEEWFESLS